MVFRIYIVLLLVPYFSFSQVLKGKVLDAATKQPIETVAVYFDNTTIGTTTNENGEFSISYSDAIQSTLVITYLGYKQVLIADYRTRNNITIELIEANIALNEVYLEYDDGLTRRQKLRLFRKEFLGTSKYAKSCKILNEDVIFLKYDKQNKTLYASAKVPVLVENKRLQYEVAFDITDFELIYRYVDIGNNVFNLRSAVYIGTTFFKDLEEPNQKRTLKNRENAYRGSVRHFMRALYNRSFKEEGYAFGKRGFIVDPYDFFTIYDTDKYGYKTIGLKERLGIFYEDKDSFIETNVTQFNVDKYGNHIPIIGVLFGGDMGDQRIGDMLPSDYGLATDK